MSEQIPFDSMKEQVLKECGAFLDTHGSHEVPLPEIRYEQGKTVVVMQLSSFHEGHLALALSVVKQHIENFRVTAFEEGHYGIQALNGNVLKTEGIFDLFKLDIFNLVSSRIECSRKGNFIQEEIQLVQELFKVLNSTVVMNPSQKVRSLGASLVEPDSSVTWDIMAGYEEVKRRIRESIIMPLQNPEIYDSIARMTRKNFESNRPRAVLFEGPPGVGKTTAARIIAGEVNIPLIYVPVESIMSKWYGQSSQNLARIFDAAEAMGGAILFLDEIDSLAGSRESGMFEATRRILSVLLRKLDGIDASSNTLTIGATNRKQDLDSALLNRFDQSILFSLPEESERAAIFRSYATHLQQEEYAALASKSEGLSGRSIRDVCEMTERRWARKLLIQKEEASVPPAEYYRRSLAQWLSESS